MRKDAGPFVKCMAATCMAVGFYTLAPPVSVNAAQTAGFTASIESVLISETNAQNMAAEQENEVLTTMQTAGAVSSMFGSITTAEPLAEETAHTEDSLICGYHNLGVADVKNILNIRKKPDSDSKMTGQLADNAGCEVLEEKDGWYKIQSGDVTGWVKKKYLLTGEKAAEQAEKIMTIKATANINGINMRTAPDMNGEIHATLDEGNSVKVIEQLGDWTKVGSEDNESYVLTESIEISESLPVAKTADEIEAEKEAKRKEKEEKQRKKDRKLRKTISGMRNSIANYALQFVGNPYVWGGTSLTNGVDCSGFVMKVYEKYGISLPHHAASQAGYGTSIRASQLRPGDLVFYSGGRGINHVALYIGGGRVVHASNPKTGIKTSVYNYRTPVKIVSLLK